MNITPELEMAIGRGVMNSLLDVFREVFGEKAAIQLSRLPDYKRAEVTMIVKIVDEVKAVPERPTTIRPKPTSGSDAGSNAH